eukprot:TRINITY_DN8750_c0_g1_i1.p1 TRINITY_DN8750_c0_g1~~TRINITY_DN8750_c0_g1_i1.p1  ORF type:complete len:123 (-),score=19.27 TRINITY_DN8750_c0_g1_i1:38-406(-)
MKHPLLEKQKSQEEFLKNCPEDQREFHQYMFRVGNASYIYHTQATNAIDEKTLRKYYEEWLEGLPHNIKIDMQKKGFDACKTCVPYTRYVNERSDIGMNEWMKEHLSEEDFKEWLKVKQRNE